jgi:hypothetical protein
VSTDFSKTRASSIKPLRLESKKPHKTPLLENISNHIQNEIKDLSLKNLNRLSNSKKEDIIKTLNAYAEQFYTDSSENKNRKY